ncbi:MAG TPA: L-rhamnose mutarotase, partial [Actinomycetes bacterium]|nr:L-rhamnose mutarotase [Actinomycetes bacterium]
MTRVCFTLQVRPDRLDEYVQRHASVWPDMLRALHNAGWHDYTLHLRYDGLLVGV